MSGWIKIHRSITNHWLYNEKRVYSKLEAWYDIIMTVNYVDNKTVIKGRLYDVKRGESTLSFESWGKRWNWDKSKVRRFFSLLQKDEMIELKCDNTTTHLTVCNYESYQGERNADETQTNCKRNSNETNIRNKERKEELFSAFWKLYDKQIDRKKCYDKFMKLDDEEIKLIFEKLPHYIRSTSDKQFRKNPTTWINGKCWNDTEYSKPQTIIYNPPIIHE